MSVQHEGRSIVMDMKITPYLWFDTEGEAAAKLYTSLFKNSRILRTTLYPKVAEEVSGKKAGDVMTVEFELDGMKFVALNGGPEFKHSEAISFSIECEDQAEVDHFWNGFTANGGEESACGWCKDPFGVSWQVVPRRLNEMMEDPDPAKVERVMGAFLPMRKLDLATLEAAYNGVATPA
jgi:predicted 3-demethylubiquinone-9 3-methyltransferase (glyoxalase superfamily)